MLTSTLMLNLLCGVGKKVCVYLLQRKTVKNMMEIYERAPTPVHECITILYKSSMRVHKFSWVR